MNETSVLSFIRLLSIAAAASTIGLGIYSAQPWGDNYAYRDISGYLGLIIFIGWSISDLAVKTGPV